MSEESKKHGNVKQKILHETRMFFIYTLFLLLLFGTFNLYERLLLGDFGNNQIRYGYCLIEALILAKIIMLGEAFNLGEKFRHQPLIIPVIHKTLLFSVLVLIFTIIEHYVIGYFNGNTIAQTYHEVTQQKMNIMFAKIFIMVIIFGLFFAVLELSRVMGEHKLYALFFKKRSPGATRGM